MENFALSELTKYLNKMGSDKHDIKLGLFSDFDIVSTVENAEFDDEIYVNVENLKGIIAGTNQRSILFGVYKYLEALGCRFIRHGLDGEIIPDNADFSKKVIIKEKAAYRHRGMCIEGAVTIENMLDNIDWAAKMGLNTYFIQLSTPMQFFERWNSHIHNPMKKPEPTPLETIQKYHKLMESEIKKRGMLYQALGHGCTCEPFGIPGYGWQEIQSDEIPAETKNALAQINGKREFWKKVPLNTNLCMSNAAVRKKVVDYCVDYIKNNPDINLLHFWLADSMNNHCECENCKDISPTDLYIKMLNELDFELTNLNLDTKIVFLLYFELLWPPETEKFNNSDRFVLMFAPITRSYSKPYDIELSEYRIPPFERNKLKFPNNISENIAFLRNWKEHFDGDSFAFDYHFMWDQYCDFGYFNAAKVLYEDIKRLKLLGLNGFVSCQPQRSFLPTGFGMYILTKTLWNDTLSFEQIAEEYFKSAFGANYNDCMQYLKELSDLCTPEYLRMELPRKNAEMEQNFKEAKLLIKNTMPLFEKCINEEKDENVSKSWLYLKFHAEFISKLLDGLIFVAKGEDNASYESFKEAFNLVRENEDIVQSVVDVWDFIDTLTRFRDNKSIC